MATCKIHMKKMLNTHGKNLTEMFVTHVKMQHISDKMLDTHGKM